MINNFSNIKCANCSKELGSERYICESYNETVCKDCTVECEICGEIVCKKCSIECEHYHTRKQKLLSGMYAAHNGEIRFNDIIEEIELHLL